MGWLNLLISVTAAVVSVLAFRDVRKERARVRSREAERDARETQVWGMRLVRSVRWLGDAMHGRLYYAEINPGITLHFDDGLGIPPTLFEEMEEAAAKVGRFPPARAATAAISAVDRRLRSEGGQVPVANRAWYLSDLCRIDTLLRDVVGMFPQDGWLDETVLSKRLELTMSNAELLIRVVRNT